MFFRHVSSRNFPPSHREFRQNFPESSSKQSALLQDPTAARPVVQVAFGGEENHYRIKPLNYLEIMIVLFLLTEFLKIPLTHYSSVIAPVKASIPGAYLLASTGTCLGDYDVVISLIVYLFSCDHVISSCSATVHFK